MVSAQAQAPADFQGWMNRGVEAFKIAQYQTAADAFQRAIDLNPGIAAAHLYLATVHMQQWIPGAVSAESIAHAQAAETEFRRTLDLDPRNAVAFGSLASLSYNQAFDADPREKARRFAEARDWSQRLISLEPRNKDPYFMLGVIAWQEWHPSLLAARAQLGMRPEDRGPLPNPEIRRDLKSRYLPTIEDGIRNLERAMEIDPDYDDAMAYMNLLVRERGDLRDTREEYLQDVVEADRWVQKALEVKKKKAQAASSRSIIIH